MWINHTGFGRYFFDIVNFISYNDLMLTYLEDFIEYIGGIRDSNGKLNNFPLVTVRLANYDVNVINSLSMQTSTGLALTDRQYHLAVKVVTKYRKQLATKGITLPENLPLRMPIRVVDRSSSIVLSEDRKELYLRFPYQPNLVDSLREFSRVSCGEVEFDSSKKQWVIGASVPNLIYMMNWAREHQFEIHFDSDSLLESLYEDYRFPVLRLDSEQEKYVVENDPGSFDLEQLNQLSDVITVLVTAGVWQIAVDNSVIKYAKQKGYSDQWIQWSTKRMLHIRPDEVKIEEFFEWVNTTDLWPVIWNSPDLNDMVYLQNVLGTDRVVNLNSRKEWNKRNPQKEKLVFFSPTLTQKQIDFVGILITRQSILYKIKHHWTHKSNKIVYWGDKLLSEVIT